MNDILFPYEYRQYQEAILGLIDNAIESKGHLILESGTGSGKTICVLTATLDYAIKNDKAVLYLTRTNSQQRQVIFELRQINGKLKPEQRIFGIGVQGRSKTCLIAKEDPELLKGTPEELSNLCNKRKKMTGSEGSTNSKSTCKFYENFCKKDRQALKRWIMSDLPTVEGIVKRCDEEKLCPYEFIKSIIRSAHLVTTPYVYFFNSFIRGRLFEWMGRDITDTIVIVDEAHNLPDYAREINSAELSIATLELAKKEALEFGSLKSSEGLSIIEFLEKLKDIILSIKNEYLTQEDGDSLVPPHELVSEIMHSFSLTSEKLKALVNDLIIHGTIIKDVKLRNDALPRSYIHSVGAFLSFWIEHDEDTHVKLVQGGKIPRLEIYCLEPSLAASPLLKSHASIHMSGTLKPLNEYRDSIGLPETSILSSFPSPFPKENRAIFYVRDVTTRYDDLMREDKLIQKMEAYVSKISVAFDKNIAVFFPSFRLMNRFLLDGFQGDLKKICYIEEQGLSQPELMAIVERFKNTDDGSSVLLSVVGGRVSEGMDFPDEELEIAILVGIPYPKPTARQKALQVYYDMKYGMGWEYAVKAPTVRKLLQSIGRLIRNEDDMGVAIILDKRARHFKSYLEGLRESIDIVKDSRDFFSKLPHSNT